MTLAEKLIKARLSLGLSQNQLGKKAGVPQQAISKIEQGNTLPRPLTRRALAAVLSIDPITFDPI